MAFYEGALFFHVLFSLSFSEAVVVKHHHERRSPISWKIVQLGVQMLGFETICSYYLVDWKSSNKQREKRKYHIISYDYYYVSGVLEL